jgi:predicted MPP superfamily phosphohydrolase
MIILKISKSVLLLIAIGLFSVYTSKVEKKLRVREDGTFTMIQLTDIHYGETNKWDAQNDQIIGKIIETEKPDFTVVTGDVVSGYAWDGETKPWFSKIYDRFA